MEPHVRAVILPVPSGYGDRLLALAEAFVASPPWQTIPNAVLVVRQTPTPQWAVIGWLDEAQAARVEAAAWQIADSLARLHYVDYRGAERDCEVLADGLVERFGDDVRSWRFRGVPRGGYIVAGMLAYLLRLPQAALTQHDLDGPTVLVDDCALSGARIRRALAATSGEVVIATLYSHPELRAAVEAAEPRVRAFVSAQDLEDHAPRVFGDGYEDWRRRWQARTEDYWIGHTDHVVFAWSEPDMTIWNPVTEEGEQGWYVVPPSHVLKTRTVRPQRLQEQPAAAGPLRPAADVLYARWEDRRLLAARGRPTVVELTGTAAEIWDCIIAEGNPDAAVTVLGSRYEVPPSQVSEDVKSLVDRLLDAGLLVQGW